MYRNLDPLDPPLPASTPRVFIKHGYGQVGTGHTPEAAQAALLEMIRQARER